MGKRFMRFGRGLAALVVALAGQALAAEQAEKHNMELVGYHDLQGAAPTSRHPQAGEPLDRLCGHHGDNILNPLTGKKEDNGTSIVDVTIRKNPATWRTFPGEPGLAERAGRRWCAYATEPSCPRATRASVPASHFRNARTRSGT